METWKECGWAGCGKRFEPSRRRNRFQRATDSRHGDAIYCSPACKQKAYRWRSRAVTESPKSTNTLRAVTRPLEHIGNTCEFRTKNAHPRPPKVIAGPVEQYSPRSLRAASLPLDPITADYQRELNNADRLRRETAWGRKSAPAQPANTPSDWQPSWQPHWPTEDLPIPQFLRRI